MPAVRGGRNAYMGPRVYAARTRADLGGPPEQAMPPDPQGIGGEAHINEEGSPLDVRARQEAPEAAVARVVTVVTHHPEAVGGNDDRAPVVGVGAIARGSGVLADVVGYLVRAHLRLHLGVD